MPHGAAPPPARLPAARRLDVGTGRRPVRSRRRPAVCRDGPPPSPRPRLRLHLPPTARRPGGRGRGGSGGRRDGGSGRSGAEGGGRAHAPPSGYDEDGRGRGTEERRPQCRHDSVTATCWSITSPLDVAVSTVVIGVLKQ